MCAVQEVTSFEPLAAKRTAAVSVCAVSTLVSLLQEAKLNLEIIEKKKDKVWNGRGSMSFKGAI